jgi:hypothetical protein
MSRPFYGFAVVFLIFLLQACGTEEGYDPTSTVTPSGYFRMGNFISDSPTLNIALGNSLQANLPYGISTAFSPVLPEIPLDLTVRYRQDDTVIPLLTNEPVNVGLNYDYTALLAGSMFNPTILKVQNPPLGQVASNRIELQFAHLASKKARPVLIALQQNASTLRQFSLSYLDVTSRIELLAGTYRVVATEIGTGNLLWESGEFSLTVGARAMVVLADYFGPGTNTVRMYNVGESRTSPFPNEQLPAAMRVVNLKPEQGPIDVYANNVLVASSVPYGARGEFTEIGFGPVFFVVTPAGDRGSVIANIDATIVGGEFHTLVVTGNENEGTGQLSVDDRRKVPAYALFTVTNGSTKVGSLDVYVVEPGHAIDDASPNLRQLSQTPSDFSVQALGLDGGTYDLVLARGNTKDVLFGPRRIDVAAGGIYSLFLTDVTGRGGEPIDLVYGDDFR